LDEYTQIDFKPFDPVHKKTEALIQVEGGQPFSVIKGAPKVIIDLCQMDAAVKQRATKAVDRYAKKGLRTLGVAKTNDQGGYDLLGIISFFDPPRIDSKKVIGDIKSYHIDVKMVTGDDLAIGTQISKDLGLGANLRTADSIFKPSVDIHSIPEGIEKKITESDGFARVFPEHKYGIVKAFQDIDAIVAMTGDGVNDAPALKQANVGIAVSGATDAARAAADLILTASGLSVITTAIEESRQIFQRMVNYVNYRVAMTINIMLFVSLSILFTNITPLTAIMIIMLALLDDIPIMAIAYDNAAISPEPLRWNLKNVLRIASVLGLVLVLENFLLMAVVKHYTDQSLNQIQTIMFLLMVIAGHLLLFVSRQKSWFWLRPWPSKELCLAIFSTQIVAILICRYGWFVTAISWKMILLVWIYALIWMFILNMFGIRFQRL
jgi:H+-transporting ATPase